MSFEPGQSSEESRRLAMMLRELSTNISTGGIRPTANNESLDSSLGLLNADALKNVSAFSEFDVSKENSDPGGDMSLGRYLQPARADQGDESVCSQPLSDSDEEEELPLNPQNDQPDQDSFQFVAPTPLSFPMAPLPQPPPQSLESSVSFVSWDNVVQANKEEDEQYRVVHDQGNSLNLPPVEDVVEDEWHQDPPDPSFCSGKFSARSTSFGGMNNTRDENFSDFSKVPSFQGSYVSQCSANMEESIFRSGYIGQEKGQSNMFPGFDVEGQSDLGQEFGDQEFGSVGKEQLMNFFDNEEAECLKENPFIEEEPCAAESPGNSSVMSGVSDKSIMLRNSNLWGGDTSKVDLEVLRKEENVKVSRCEYFRHNSSRLGSLDDSVEDSQRPDLGFFHNIRSPERKPCSLLSTSKSSPASSSRPSLSGTFQVKPMEVEADTDSAPSSANTTYMASGDSTKTVVSLGDQTDTLKAAELVNRLQSLADQLGGQGGAVGGVTPTPVIYPDVVEDSIICSNTSKLEESIREALDQGQDINISTISKVLSEASISSDPQHFVNVILGCLKGKVDPILPAEEENESAGNQSTSSLPEKADNTKRISFDERTALKHNTPKASSTLPRTKRSSTTPSGRLSHTPTQTSKMTPSESRRAMLRLTPSSHTPVSRTRTSGGAKPIRPFNTVSAKTPHQVAPVRPQQAVSAPASARSTPTPPLSKSESVPGSLNKSGTRQRKLSGTRHSSPIKKVQIQTPPQRSLASTPTSDELSRLLDTPETPHVQMAATSQLTTSTPFHPGNNLSLVMLDHLTQNTSVSPLVNPDTSLCAVNLDVSTISPALYTSVLNTVKEQSRKKVTTISMLPDWSYESVAPSHTRTVVSIPIEHNITTYCNCVIKITNMWVGSCEVPPEHWDALVTTSKESLILLDQGTQSCNLEFTMKKEGAFTFNVGLMLDNGVSTSGLVRVQVEDPNIQVLTSDGNKIDFGVLSLNCWDIKEMILVNSGNCDLPLYIQLKQPSQIFSFEDGSMETNFTMPGHGGKSEDRGKGVAKQLKLKVNTRGVSPTEPRIFQTHLSIILGSNRDDTLLGTVPLVAKVGDAKLVVQGTDSLQFGTNDVGSSKNVVLRNVGNVPLVIKCSIPPTSGQNPEPYYGLSKSKIIINPNSSANYPVTLMKQIQTTSQSSRLVFQVHPNGPNQVVKLSSVPASAQSSSNIISSSRPGLSFGVIKNPSVASATPSPALPTVFPVESDRSLVNFFCVEVGSSEQQTVALRNSTQETILLSLIIRETDCFKFEDRSQTRQLTLEPQQTREVSVLYWPVNTGRKDTGKLVLKPQGIKLGGKSFKASIALTGLVGASNIIISGVEKTGTDKHSLTFTEGESVKTFVVTNHGSVRGFVKILASGSSSNYLDVTPTTFLLGPGAQKPIRISLAGDTDGAPLELTMFHGAETLRQILKTARKLSGAARLVESASIPGFNPMEEIPGETKDDIKELDGKLAPVDVKHFFKKISGEKISIKVPVKTLAEFDQLSVEETLSETRIDQSIALPLHTTNMFRSEEASKPFLNNSVQSPPTSDSTADIKITPDRIQLKPGGECLLRLANLTRSKVHWDMSWPSSKLSINPGSGILEAGSEAIVCVEAVKGGQSWKGQVQVYTDNSVLSVNVVLSGGEVTSQAPRSQISVSTKSVSFPSTHAGHSANSSLSLTNTTPGLVQWRAVMEPSFFSIAQSSGLLNPGQSVQLGLTFKPAAAGQHSASLAISSAPVRGGLEAGASLPSQAPVTVSLSGAASAPKEVPSYSKALPSSGRKPGTGTVSLENDVITFQSVKIGAASIAKMKIENRSGEDKVVEILPLPPQSPFQTVHSVVEVKNRCFSNIPINYLPRGPGEHSAEVRLRWDGNILTAKLRGEAV